MTERSGIIFDLDGTVYRGDQLIPGARETIEKLRHWAYPLVFVTNALETPAEHAAKLTRFKIPTSPDEVITAPLLVTRYLGRHMPNATVFAISDPPLLTQLEANFRLSEDPEEIDVVIVSCDLDFNFRKLNIGFQALKRGARFLAINADATCPVPGGEVPDAGAIIGALEGCSKRKLELVVGKPSQMAAEAVLERLDKPAGDCWMVGDNLESDILMGQRAGMSTVLVLTGVTRPADLAHSSIEPDHVLDSIAQLPQLLEKN